MADQESIFNTIDDTIEGDLEIENLFSGNVSTDDLLLASDEDKKQAEATGKAESADSKKTREIEEALEKDKAETKSLMDEEILGKDDTTKTPAKPGNDTEETSVVNGLQEFANELYDLGFFTKDSDDETPPKTGEELLQKLQKEKEKGAEELLENFLSKNGDEYREVFDAIFVNGASPREYLAKYNEIQSFKGMDLGDEDSQVKVVQAALRKQGWEEEDIRDKIKSLRINSELETDAQRYHKALVKSEEAELAKIEVESKAKVEQKKAMDTQFKSSIRNILKDKLKIKEFDGIPLTQQIAEKSIDMLETKKWKLPNGELITDLEYAILDLRKPENHSELVKLSLLLNSFEPGKPIKLSLNSVAAKAVSNEKKSLFDKLATRTTTARETNNKSKQAAGFWEEL